MSYAVRTEDLGRRFGATEALSGLDLAVEPGTVLGLLGHNGAGKTTAVRILTTLLAPTTGRAVVAGRDVAREPDAVRERIAVAGQEASLDERLTGRENLMLLGRLQKLSKRDAIARTRRDARALRDRPRRRPPGRHLLRRHAPPAGPRRVPDARPAGRVPRRADDRPGPGSRAEMWGAIAGLVDDGAALILTTQYLEEADRLADQIVVLQRRADRRRGHAGRAQARASATGACTSRVARLRRRPRSGSSASSPSSTRAPAGSRCPRRDGPDDLRAIARRARRPSTSRRPR